MSDGSSARGSFRKYATGTKKTKKQPIVEFLIVVFILALKRVIFFDKLYNGIQNNGINGRKTACQTRLTLWKTERRKTGVLSRSSFFFTLRS